MFILQQLRLIHDQIYQLLDFLEASQSGAVRLFRRQCREADRI